MQTEIEKMSDIELLHAYAGCNNMKLYQASEKELLKRLSKNNIEEFKKKLGISIMNNNHKDVFVEDEVCGGFHVNFIKLHDLINNIGKE